MPGLEARVELVTYLWGKGGAREAGNYRVRDGSRFTRKEKQREWSLERPVESHPGWPWLPGHWESLLKAVRAGKASEPGVMDGEPGAREAAVPAV